MFKVIVAGGRDFNDYKLLKRKLDRLLRGRKPSEIEIVSGCASGADRLGERYAKEKGYSLAGFPAQWSEYKGIAGHRRNAEMAQYADACVCFWDGHSKGTENMIKMAQFYGIQLRVIEYRILK